MKKNFIHWNILSLSLLIFFTLPVYCQVNSVITAGATLVNIFKHKKTQSGYNNPQAKDTATVVNFNSKAANQFARANIQDISGVWEGEQSNGDLIMYYSLSLTKLSDDASYSGFDYCIWEKSLDRKPINPNGGNPPNAKKSFIGKFENGELQFTEIAKLENTNWNLTTEKFKFVDDNGTPAIINDNNQPTRKLYLKRTSQAFPEEYLKYVINENTLQIINPVVLNSNNQEILKYNDHEQLFLSVKNNSEIDLSNVKGQLTTTETKNGIIDYDKLYGTFTIGNNSKSDLPLSFNTNFSVPRGVIHFNIAFSYDGIILSQKTIDVPTESFYRISELTVPEYTSPRMRAVAGYYGFLNTSYADVSKELYPLISSGDKMANMWKAICLYMGYGESKIDENEAYSVGKVAFDYVEDKARNGDAEALYLLFYACQMGLEGDAGKSFANDFLKKSALAGFIPAKLDYALVADERKDYSTALNELLNLYNSGVKISATIIGRMYENGWGANKDVNTAIEWYKKGMAFGDPKANLYLANLYSTGFENSAPNASEAMSLATAAAAKNCTGAMLFLGEKYTDGKQGVARNMPLAIKWLKEGAEKGDRQAMLAFGQIYTGKIPEVSKDEHTAYYWISKSAQAGCPAAMLILASHYKEENSPEYNVIKARYWYNQSVLGGYANQDNAAMRAVVQSFSDFWNYADFSPSYYYIDEYGYRTDGDDGFFNGMISGVFGAMSSYYGHQQQLIDGLEYICKRNGDKIYGGTVSSNFYSNLYLKQGQTVDIKAYGIISTGMMSGMANADGLGNNWQEYTFVKGIPCSSVMANIKGSSEWKFIGQSHNYTAPSDGALALALNGIDYRNYKGYFDIVVRVPDN